MQSSNGKKKDSKSIRCLGGRSLACFSLVFLTTFSCSHFKKTDFKKIGKSVQALCLSGKGTGRLEHPRGRHVFDYQSLLNKKTTTWSLGFDLPIIGQEIIHLNYVTRVATGTFERRLAIEVKSKQELKYLNKFYGKLSHLVAIADGSQLEPSWQITAIDDSFMAKSEGFLLKAFSYDGKFFKRMTISYKMGRDDLVLQLFAKECQ